MNSRIFATGARALQYSSSRGFQTSARRLDAAVAGAPVLPARKPMGAFRGGYVYSSFYTDIVFLLLFF
jgi:hypothetical protein